MRSGHNWNGRWSPGCFFFAKTTGGNKNHQMNEAGTDKNISHGPWEKKMGFPRVLWWVCFYREEVISFPSFSCFAESSPDIARKAWMRIVCFFTLIPTLAHRLFPPLGPLSQQVRQPIFASKCCVWTRFNTSWHFSNNFCLAICDKIHVICWGECRHCSKTSWHV